MQRRHSISTPVWPYIAVVTCLFALSVLAPRLWRAGTQVGDSVRGETAPSRATRKLARDLRLEDQLVALGDFFAPRQTAAVAPPVARRHSHASTGAALPFPPEHELDLRLAYRSSLRPLTPQSESIPLMELPSSVAKASGHRSARCGCGMALSRCAIRQLEQLAQHAKGATWATAVKGHIDALVRDPSLSSSQISRHLLDLEVLASEAETAAHSKDNIEIRANLLRTRYALLRRLAVWKQVNQIVNEGADTYLVSLADSGEVIRCLEALDRELGPSTMADDWRRYLMLDELRLVMEAGDAAQQGPLARTILARMESHQLSDSQLRFLQSRVFWELGEIVEQLCAGTGRLLPRDG